MTVPEKPLPSSRALARPLLRLDPIAGEPPRRPERTPPASRTLCCEARDPGAATIRSSELQLESSVPYEPEPDRPLLPRQLGEALLVGVEPVVDVFQIQEGD
jgi:hypothetical protein